MLIVHGTAKSPLLSSCSLHSHDCWEVILNLFGSGMEEIGGIKEAFYPGSVTVCPPNVPHAKTCAAGGFWQDIYVRFSFDGFRLSRLRYSDDSDHTMERLLELMQNASARHEEGRFRVTLAQAVCALLQDWNEPHASDDLTERIKNEISHRFSDPEFSPRRILTGLGYNEDYLRRRFRRFTGLTPTEYLTALRIGHARMLLAQNGPESMSVRDIALLSGFYDSDYFSRVFRRETGCSPRNYQKTRETGKQ